MKVLIINDYPSGGGAEEHVKGLARLLANEGNDVRQLTGKRGVLHYLGRWGNPLLTLRSARIMREFAPDVVHVHKHNLYWGASPFRAASRLGIPLVCTEHDFSGICPEGWMVNDRGATCPTGFGPHCWSLRCLRSDRPAMDAYRRFNLLRLQLQKRTMISGTSLFLAPSNFLSKWLAQKYAPVPSRTMPSSIDPPPARHRLPLEGFTVFLASRLEREKGVDVFLRALASCPDVMAVIAGDGSQADALKMLASRLGLERQVAWVGRLTQEEVREQCRKSHLVVQPSLWIEGGGDATLSILEAMAEGCAVASSRFGEDPDVIEHGVNGWLVERGSIEDWQHILSLASSSPSHCLQMGEVGSRKVAEERSPSKLLDRIHDAYRFALSRTPPRHGR